MVLLLIFHFLWYITSCGARSSTEMTTRSYPGYIEVEISPHPVNVAVESQIIGTGIKTAYNLKKNQTRITISTEEHPGLYIIRLVQNQNGSVLVTRYIHAVCQKHVTLDLNQTYSIQSPEFPLPYHAGLRCSWTITTIRNDTWFKIDTVTQGSDCLTSFESNFKTDLCSKAKRNESLVLPNNSLYVNFSSIKTGPSSYIHLEVIPKLRPPTNLSATALRDFIQIDWFWNGTDFDALVCVIEYLVYPSTINYQTLVNCSDNSFTLNISLQRGRFFQIRMFARTSFWESEKLNYVNLTLECQNEVFLRDKNETAILSEGYPYHLQPFSSCQWDIKTSADKYIKFTIRDFNLCSNSNICRTTCLKIDKEIKLCPGSSIEKTYLIQKNTTFIMFNSTETLNGRGFNLSVKAVDSPPPFLDQFFVESKHDFIKITWRPYDGEKDLLRYLVTYNVIPDVGHHVVPVRVGRPSTTYVIDTNTHQGQLFAVRLSYLSEGGEGIPSNVKIIRASCGRAVRLRHNQTFTIRSPEVNGSYLSNVICRWNLQADHGLWYKLDIVKLDIENSTLCQKDYVEIPGKRRFCGNKPDSVIIKDHRAAITFVTDDSNYATGFTAMATAVYPPSGRPRNLTLTPARYGFFSEWEKPFLNPSYVRGYRINYRRLEKTEVSEMVVPSNDNSAFINTLSFPGNLFEVWMSAIGEAQDSALTEKRQILSDCGEFLKIDKSVHLISTPFYPEFPNVTCQCSWTLSSLHNLSFSFLEIHRYDNHTTNSTEDEFLILNNTKHSFANISEGMQFLLHKNEVEKIEIRTKKTSFLAAIKPVHDEETSVRSFKRSSSSVQRLDPS